MGEARRGRALAASSQAPDVRLEANQQGKVAQQSLTRVHEKGILYPIERLKALGY